MSDSDSDSEAAEDMAGETFHKGSRNSSIDRNRDRNLTVTKRQREVENSNWRSAGAKEIAK